MSEHKIPIPSRIYNATVGGHVTGADQIIDDNTGLTLDKVAGGALEEKEYTSGSNNGMGRVVLRKNLVEGVNTLTQSMINKSNTIYVIQYDFTLSEDITIPDNCVLKFNGGSIKGTGSIAVTSSITVDGYGLLVAFTTADDCNKTHFLNPYHVDVFSQDAIEDGSKQHPFHKLQVALNLCNDIRIKRNNIITPEVTTNIMASLTHDTRILPYGTGARPLFSGRCIINNVSKSYNSDTKIVTVDLTNSYLEYKDLKTIAYNQNNTIFNFGLLSDTHNVLSRIISSSTPNMDYCWYNELLEHSQSITDDSYKYIYIKGLGNNFYYTTASTGGGIYCESHALSIEGVDFEYIAGHAIYGKASNMEVKDCSFYAIGGAIHYTRVPFVLFGNAIEIYFGSNPTFTHNLIVENCLFSNVYDAAVTIQGRFSRTQKLRVFNNKFVSCGYGIELFSYNLPNVYDNCIVGEICGNIFSMCESSKRTWFEFKNPESHIVRDSDSAIRIWINKYLYGEGLAIDNNTFINSTFYSVCNPDTTRPFKAKHNNLIYKSGYYFRKTQESKETGDIEVNSTNKSEIQTLLDSFGPNNVLMIIE